MNITVTKEEMNEIIRMYIIGTELERDIITENHLQKENEEEIELDKQNLIRKLFVLAEKGKAEIKALTGLENEENLIEKLIERRKRTYTSKYWNFIQK